MNHTVRVWDAPTRLFHWGLAVSVLGLFITAKMGGEAMVWHFRLGYTVLTLLLFRLVWGFVGGYWSRFTSFLFRPVQIIRYLQGRSDPNHCIGHNPAGSLSVFAMLGLLAVQVATGLCSDDEISAAGPLSRHVAEVIVNKATSYHTTLGQVGLVLLVGMHLAALAFYFFKQRENLVKTMVTGDKLLTWPATASSDRWSDRIKALSILILCALSVATWISWLG